MLGRERGGEFHDPMIEKRRPHFHRVRHAGVIHLGQDIVRKKVFLIEPEISLQIVAGRQFVQHGIERGRQRRLNQRALFPIVERSAPVAHGRAPRASGSLPGNASACIRSRSYRSDTGQRRAAASSVQRRTWQSAGGTRKQAGPMHQVSAEQFVGALAAERDRGAGLGQLGKKPHRQRARIGVRLVGVVSELLESRRADPARGLRSSSVMLGAVRSPRPGAHSSVSSKLRPRKEMENVLRRELDASAA